jgi:hypothetical protein
VAKPITPEEMTAYVEATWNKCQEEAWQEQEPVGYAHVEDLKREHHDFYVNRQRGINEVPLYTAPQKEWVGLNHFDRTLLRTTYAPLKRLHHSKETNTDIVAEIVDDWDAFFTAIEAKLKEKNT